MLKIYNSLSRKKEVFTPIDATQVKLYVCGPTVYNEVHLGNCRTFISFDIVFRYLKHLGYKVCYVRNITDVGHLENDLDEGEDKIAKKAKSEKLEPMEIAHQYTYSFHEIMRLFNVLPPSIEPQATGHIIEQIELIKNLLSKDLAYEINGSVYFDLKKYSQNYDYGILSGRKIEDLLSHSRDLKNLQEKRNSYDFALWKKAEPSHIMRWPSPWSEGFPGWHLECSAMSKKYLGAQFDIHGGGMDLKFPHHECEIIQGQGAFDKLAAKYWIHSNILSFEGEKMSKSKGNVLLPREIFSGNTKLLREAFDPMTLRFFMLQAHYGSELNFSNEALIAARKAYHRLMETYLDLDKIYLESAPQESSSFDVNAWIGTCYEKLNDDFNTPLLLAELFKIPKLLSSIAKREEFINQKDKESLKTALGSFLFDVLGLQLPKRETKSENPQELIDFLLELRNQARLEKNWKLSDQIREKLEKLNIQLQDKKI